MELLLQKFKKKKNISVLYGLTEFLPQKSRVDKKKVEEITSEGTEATFRYLHRCSFREILSYTLNITNI